MDRTSMGLRPDKIGVYTGIKALVIHHMNVSGSLSSGYILNPARRGHHNKDPIISLRDYNLM